MRVKLILLLVLLAVAFAATHRVKAKHLKDGGSHHDGGHGDHHGADNPAHQFKGREAEYVAEWVVGQIFHYFFVLQGDEDQFENWINDEVMKCFDDKDDNDAHCPVPEAFLWYGESEENAEAVDEEIERLLHEMFTEDPTEEDHDDHKHQNLAKVMAKVSDNGHFLNLAAKKAKKVDPHVKYWGDWFIQSINSLRAENPNDPDEVLGEKAFFSVLTCGNSGGSSNCPKQSEVQWLLSGNCDFNEVEEYMEQKEGSSFAQVV